MSYGRNGRNHRPAPPLVRAGQSGKRRAPADQDAYRQRRDAMAEAVASRLASGRDYDAIAEQIEPLMVQLRAATTPAERAALEQQIRPLAQMRRMWRPV